MSRKCSFGGETMTRVLSTALRVSSRLQFQPLTTIKRNKRRHQRLRPAATSAAASEARSDAPESSSAGKLPVRRVVLYKNGVGYFEHLGRVRGSQDVHIDFTSAQLNDVLKSLTVLDLNGGRITGVDYNSEAPLARRLGTLRLALSERPSVSEFLGALRGARIEVRGRDRPRRNRKIAQRRTQNAQLRKLDFGDRRNLADHRHRRSPHRRSESSDERPHRRSRPATRSRQISRPDRFGARTRCPPHDRFNRRHRRPQPLRQLHQRSTDLEDHLSHRAALESPTKSRCCKAGRSSTTPSAKIGTTSIYRSSPARRTLSSSNSPNRITDAAPSFRFPRASRFRRRLTVPR